MTQKFTAEFQASILSLYRSGTSATTLADEYGVSVQTIYKWAKTTKGNPATSYTNDDIKTLEERALKAEAEVAILKKALAIFGRRDK